MINVCILAGNLCKDVEIKTFGEMEVANTSLAINEGYGDKQKTHYANIVAYGETGKNMAKILKKGSKASFECKYTNGYTEGTNNAIKVIKRNAFGYRNFNNFRNRIFLSLT